MNSPNTKKQFSWYTWIERLHVFCPSRDEFAIWRVCLTSSGTNGTIHFSLSLSVYRCWKEEDRRQGSTGHACFAGLCREWTSFEMRAVPTVSLCFISKTTTTWSENAPRLPSKGLWPSEGRRNRGWQGGCGWTTLFPVCMLFGSWGSFRTTSKATCLPRESSTALAMAVFKTRHVASTGGVNTCATNTGSARVLLALLYYSARLSLNSIYTRYIIIIMASMYMFRLIYMCVYIHASKRTISKVYANTQHRTKLCLWLVPLTFFSVYDLQQNFQTSFFFFFHIQIHYS